jgi:hypothetical protein
MISAAQAQATKESNAIDANYLDQEFARYIQMAQDLMRKMRSAEDRRICARYVTDCSKLKSENLQIKNHRNRFFRYVLKVMKRTVDHQVEQNDILLNIPDEMLNDLNQKNEVQQWSNDGRTYVASKIIPGYATLVYLAVTPEKEDGWDHNGWAKFTKHLPNIDVEQILLNQAAQSSE